MLRGARCKKVYKRTCHVYGQTRQCQYERTCHAYGQTRQHERDRGRKGTEPEQRKKGSASARHVMDRHTRAKGEWEEDDRVAQLSKESEGQRENWVWLYNESK